MEIDIKKIAKLSRLRIEEDKLEKFEHDMKGIVEMVEKLPNIQSDEHLIDPQNPMELRPDVVKPSVKREELFANAPKMQAGCLVVPKVIE